MKNLKGALPMKKRISYVICGVVLVMILVVLLVFAFSGNDTQSNETVDITGTWKVVTYVSNGSATLVENEFMIFSDNQAEAYRDKNKEPYASSSYTIDSYMLLELPEISRKYTVDIRSRNHMRLYENANEYMCLIRYPNEDMSSVETDTSIVAGKWDVTYRDSDNNYSDEYLVFEEKQMHDYHGNSKNPTAILDYTWDEKLIVISTIDKTMEFHIISDTEIAFVETDTGYIWELKKS